MQINNNAVKTDFENLVNDAKADGEITPKELENILAHIDEALPASLLGALNNDSDNLEIRKNYDGRYHASDLSTQGYGTADSSFQDPLAQVNEMLDWLDGSDCDPILKNIISDGINNLIENRLSSTSSSWDGAKEVGKLSSQDSIHGSAQEQLDALMTKENYRLVKRDGNTYRSRIQDTHYPRTFEDSEANKEDSNLASISWNRELVLEAMPLAQAAGDKALLKEFQKFLDAYPEE